MVERAVVFCPVTPDLVVHILRSTLTIDPQSHDRGVCRSSYELVCVLARPIVAIVRNGRERILSAPLIVVAHRIGWFIFAFRTDAGNSSADIPVHECFPSGNDRRHLRVITLCSPDVPAPEKGSIGNILILVDLDIVVGNAFLGECRYHDIARNELFRRVEEHIVTVEYQRRKQNRAGVHPLVVLLDGVVPEDENGFRSNFRSSGHF